MNTKISLLSIVILSAAGTVSELGYAVEGAYAIPVLLEAGISLKYASIMLSLSPVIQWHCSPVFCRISLGSMQVCLGKTETVHITLWFDCRDLLWKSSLLLLH